MTNEQAKSELEQLYMSLSEEKKKALDVAFKAMEQADNIPEMYYPQVDGITPTVVAQTDGEYISRKALLEDLYKRDYTKFTHRDFVALVQYQDIVAIPPDHDGCKDCRWQSQSETEMPCKQCMHNYTDEWQKKPHWIMKHRTINEVKYHTGLDDMGEEHTIKELIRYEVDEPYCSECGMKAGDTSQNYCCFCGVKMD